MENAFTIGWTIWCERRGKEVITIDFANKIHKTDVFESEVVAGCVFMFLRTAMNDAYKKGEHYAVPKR